MGQTEEFPSRNPLEDNPHKMTYEVVQVCPGKPIATMHTSIFYDDCVSIFQTLLEQDGHARLDLVVRQDDGRPICRISVLDMEYVNAKRISDYTNPGGKFDTGVYNEDYKDKPWAGYEKYSVPHDLI